MSVRWTELAARDLTGICDYTEEHSGPEAARKVALRVYEAVDSLSSRILADPDASQAPGNLSSPAYPFSLYIVSAKTLSK
jgi:plasmid stabilization system protein ParE